MASTLLGVRAECEDHVGSGWGTPPQGFEGFAQVSDL